MSETWSGRTVLVTGGLGFIGSNLVIELAGLGAHVTVIDCVAGQHGGNISNIACVADRIVLHDADIRDAEFLARIVQGNEFIFSLAGQVSHPHSMTDPISDLDMNCRAQLALLEACRINNPDARIVFASTRQVYGRPLTRPVDERHQLRPVDVNGISKMAAEHFFRLYWEVHEIRSVSLRLTNTYGPRMDLQSAGRGFINACLAQALAGEVISLFGNGEQLRDFIYVADVVDALKRASRLQSGWGAAYNLSHPQPCSLRDFVTTLGRFINVRFQLVPFPPDRASIDVGDYWGCSLLFQQLTGWTAETSLHDGLRETVLHFQEQRQTEGATR